MLHMHACAVVQSLIHSAICFLPWFMVMSLQFNAWLGASVVRAVAAVLAWLLACHTSHHTAVTAARLQRQAALHTAAATAAALTHSSQGQSLDAISSAKLQALAAELRRGAEQAEHTVHIRQQQQLTTAKSFAATADYSHVSAAATAV
jgi:hypothetical protein